MKKSRYEKALFSELWDVLYELPPVVLNELFSGNHVVRFKDTSEFGCWAADKMVEHINNLVKRDVKNVQETTIMRVTANLGFTMAVDEFHKQLLARYKNGGVTWNEKAAKRVRTNEAKDVVAETLKFADALEHSILRTNPDEKNLCFLFDVKKQKVHTKDISGCLDPFGEGYKRAKKRFEVSFFTTSTLVSCQA